MVRLMIVQSAILIKMLSLSLMTKKCIMLTWNLTTKPGVMTSNSCS